MMIPPVAQQPTPPVSVMFIPVPLPPDCVGVPGVFTSAATTHPFPAPARGQAAELDILKNRKSVPAVVFVPLEVHALAPLLQNSVMGDAQMSPVLLTFA